MTDISGANVLFMTSRSKPAPGRLERRMLAAMEELVRAGANVSFICRPESLAADTARDLGASVAVYELDRKNIVRTRSRLRKYLKRNAFHLAHSTGFAADALLRSAASGLPVRIVNSYEASRLPLEEPERLRARLRLWQEAKAVRRADALVVDTSYTADRLRAAGIEADRIMVDPTSVSIERVLRQAEQPPDVALAAGPSIGYAGDLQPSRGLHTLIGAGRIIHMTRPEVIVIIAGEGPEEDNLALASAGGSARLVGRPSSVPAVLRRLDVCCFPSVLPGTPTTLVEAAALGRPIVAAAVPGIAELYEDSREIVLVPSGDAKALAEAAMALLDDPERAASLGEAARLRTIDEYSAAASVRRHMALYKRLLAG
jgi:glycosyltransferase involved in cell wall biosynthesis